MFQQHVATIGSFSATKVCRSNFYDGSMGE